MTPNREVSTCLSAADFCAKQYKQIYLPAKAPPSSSSFNLQYGTIEGQLAYTLVKLHRLCGCKHLQVPCIELASQRMIFNKHDISGS